MQMLNRRKRKWLGVPLIEWVLTALAVAFVAFFVFGVFCGRAEAQTIQFQERVQWGPALCGTFQCPIERAVVYELHQSSDGGPYSILNSVPWTGDPDALWLDVTLDAGVEYRWRVVATDRYGMTSPDSEASDSHRVELIGTPDKPRVILNLIGP